jgi:hypothetical protein
MKLILVQIAAFVGTLGVLQTGLMQAQQPPRLGQDSKHAQAPKEPGAATESTSGSGAQTVATPMSTSSLRIAVDVRVELLSLLFRLAGNPEYCQCQVQSYDEDARKQFDGFSQHAVVQLARELRRTRGVSYDACMSMAVHLSDAYQPQLLLPLDPWPDGLDKRWPPEGVSRFLSGARQFVDASNFKEFIQRHQPLYDTTTARMKALMEKEGHLEWFHDYFGEKPQAAFAVVLGMLNGGCCYGPHLRDATRREELFCVLGVWKTDAEGLPVFTRGMLSTVVHEFCHSYANAVIQRHYDELRPAGEKLFEGVSRQMQSQAYGNGQTMLCESLERACVVRYRLRYEGPDAAQREIQDQKKRGFLWMDELSQQLAEYEAHRDQYSTLESFSPRLISFFKDYAGQNRH